MNVKKIRRRPLLKGEVIPRRVCLHCGNRWIPRVEVTVKCPSCNSPYWNRRPAVEKLARSAT